MIQTTKSMFSGLRPLALALALAAPVGLVACTGGGGSTAEVSVTSAQTAAGLAKKIQARPGDADAILKEAGTDRAAFEALLYDIAQDPEASRAYADAMR
jgi:hypothetical protein